MVRHFAFQVTLSCVLIVGGTAGAAVRETDKLVQAQLEGLTSITGSLVGEFDGFEQQLELVADACVHYPALKDEVARIANEVKELEGNQKKHFLQLFKLAACGEARDCELANRMSELERRMSNIEGKQHAPSQVLPSPAPGYQDSPPDFAPLPPSQNKAWTGPIHRIIPKPASGLVTANQRFWLVDTCVDYVQPNGQQHHGNVYALADGSYVLVTHTPRTAYQPMAAIR